MARIVFTSIRSTGTGTGTGTSTGTGTCTCARGRRIGQPAGSIGQPTSSRAPGIHYSAGHLLPAVGCASGHRRPTRPSRVGVRRCRRCGFPNNPRMARKERTLKSAFRGCLRIAGYQNLMERRRTKLARYRDAPDGAGVACVRIQRSIAVSLADQDQGWRVNGRREALAGAVAQTAGLDWSPRLLRLLLEELYVDEEVEDLLGPASRVAITEFPQVIAVALALRYSWRRDTFRDFLNRLDLKRRSSRS